MSVVSPFAARQAIISPSLLAADFNSLDAELKRIAEAGAQWLHLDVMDGHFVPNISFGVPVIAAIRKNCPLFFDTHLMISRPSRYAAAFAQAGADLITFHLESDDDPQETVTAIRQTGCRVGISLKPATPAERIFPWLDKIDLVLVMTVEPGFGGQRFMADMLPKAAAIRREIDGRGLPVRLEADGGIGPGNAAQVFAAGIDTIVAGTSVFRAPEGTGQAVRSMLEAWKNNGKITEK